MTKPNNQQALFTSKNVNVSIHFYYTSCFFSSSQKIIFLFFCVMQLITTQKRSNDQHSNEKHSNLNIRMLILYMVSIISITIFHLKRDLFIAQLLFCTAFIALIREICTVFKPIRLQIFLRHMIINITMQTSLVMCPF